MTSGSGTGVWPWTMIAPWPAERVRDDDADRTRERFGQRLAQAIRRGVGLPRQNGDPSQGDIRRVHTRVCADESVVRLGDQHAAIHPDDPARLPEDDLDDSWIPAVRGRPFARQLGWDDAVEPHHGTFRLRHDLLRDHEDVASTDRASHAVAGPDRAGNQPPEVGAGHDLGDAGNREDMKLGRHDDDR